MPDVGNDWTDTPYVRVYLTFADDYQDVYRDDRLFAWWVRLLMAADRFFPASAPLPYGIPPDVVQSLDASSAIDVELDRYRVKGLSALRTKTGNDNRGTRGGVARATTADRRLDGTFGATSVDPASRPASRPASQPASERERPASYPANGTSVPTSVPTSVNDAGSTLVEPASTTLVEPASNAGSRPASQPASTLDTSHTTQHNTPNDDDPYGSSASFGGSVSTLRAPALATPAPASRARVDPDDVIEREPGSLDPLTPALRAAMVRSHGPDDADCDEPDLHPLHHRFYVGVGWKCLLCERADTRSFDDRFIDAGGRPF